MAGPVPRFAAERGLAMPGSGRCVERQGTRSCVARAGRSGRPRPGLIRPRDGGHVGPRVRGRGGS